MFPMTGDVSIELSLDLHISFLEKKPSLSVLSIKTSKSVKKGGIKAAVVSNVAKTSEQSI